MKSKTITLKSIREEFCLPAKFDQLLKKSSQVIVFGSVAAGVHNQFSDLDILFVTNGRRVKLKYFDFVCVSPDRLHLKSWLGSELATHVAKYGIWIKGKDNWSSNAFISKGALERKKIIILHRLTHLWIKHASVTKNAMLKLFKDVILDSYRLVQMSEGLAVSPNKILVKRFLDDRRNILNEITKPKYLDDVGSVFFEQLFASPDFEQLNIQVKELVTLGYDVIG